MEKIVVDRIVRMGEYGRTNRIEKRE